MGNYQKNLNHIRYGLSPYNQKLCITAAPLSGILLTNYGLHTVSCSQNVRSLPFHGGVHLQSRSRLLNHIIKGTTCRSTSFCSMHIRPNVKAYPLMTGERGVILSGACYDGALIDEFNGRLSVRTLYNAFKRGFTSHSGNQVLLKHFNELLEAGHLLPSDAQVRLINKMQTLLDQLILQENTEARRDRKTASPPAEAPEASQITLFSRLWKSFSKDAHAASVATAVADHKEAPLTSRPRAKGVYIWGGVGQGKTMIMDAFYDVLPIKKKLRVHFHHFMLKVHQRLHQMKTEKSKYGNSEEADPLSQIASEIHETANVLCFDEFQVVHITDAMILKKLFERLFSEGITVVTTSNRPPDDLYKDGLNRKRFLPFIALLKDTCDIESIETNVDFRLRKIVSTNLGLYQSPSRSIEDIRKQLMYLSNGAAPEEGELMISPQRSINIKYKVDKIAIFSFDELCVSNVGAADFLAISENFHTIFLYDIPSLQNLELKANEIRRFIYLIDVMYERHMRVVYDAALPLFQLFGPTGIIVAYEAMRKAIIQRYKHLQDALLEIAKFGASDGYLEDDEFVDALHKVLHVDPNIAHQIFATLSGVHGNRVPAASLRAALYFHSRNYDFSPPNLDDEFLFGYHDDGKLMKVEVTEGDLAFGYELYSEGSSTGSGDVKFASVRTISRMREMISLPYLQKHQQLHSLKDLNFFGLAADSEDDDA